MPLEMHQSVTILVGGSHHCTPAWRSTVRQHGPLIKCYRPVSGTADLFDPEGCKLPLKPGQLYIIPGHLPLGYRCAKAMHIHWLHIRLHDPIVAGLLATLEAPATVPVASAANEVAILDEICTNQSGPVTPTTWPELWGDHRLQLKLQGALLSLIGQVLPAGQLNLDPRLIRALDLLDQQLQQACDTDHLAKRLGWTPTHLRRRFKEAFGCTPQAHHERHRILRAQELLRDPNLSIAAVAKHCGWDDPLYFSKIFKRQLGLAPSHWRRRLVEP